MIRGGTKEVECLKVRVYVFVHVHMRENARMRAHFVLNSHSPPSLSPPLPLLLQVGAVLVEGRPSLSRRALERTARELVASCVAFRGRDSRFAPFLHARTPLTTTTVGK